VTQRQEQLRLALKRAASALKQQGPQFALGGSYALWVHGAPEPLNDVDLVVAEDEVEAAAKTLAAAGFDIERTPEDWLFKAHFEDVVVDVLHRLNGRPIDHDLLSRTDQCEVLAIRMPVLRPTDLVTVKLMSLSEHYCDFELVLPVVRAVREQLDWPRIRADTAASPFAVSFLTLADLLGITRPDAPPAAAATTQ
jgi:hypothetical protein